MFQQFSDQAPLLPPQAIPRRKNAPRSIAALTTCTEVNQALAFAKLVTPPRAAKPQSMRAMEK